MGHRDQYEDQWRKKGGFTPREEDVDFRSLVTGPILVRALGTLHLLMDGVDDRFGAAALALKEFCIVDHKGRYRKDWLPPMEFETQYHVACMVQACIDEGYSERRACSRTAAICPVRAASFEAAEKKTKLIYKKMRHVLTDEKYHDTCAST